MGKDKPTSKSDNYKSVKPYGSAKDLPSYKELREQLKAFKLLTILPRLSSNRKIIRELETKLNQLTSVVDSFYALLGVRKWVFHEKMNLKTIEGIVKEGTNIELAEKKLIDTYRDNPTMESYIQGLYAHEEFRFRRHHIERALEHYRAGHFDSCVLHLLAVMDGFVNDYPDENRIGLHAREKGDMVAWDSVTGHHLGLYSVMDDFKATFKKRVDDEVFNLHRHGIVHGSIANFDNVIVATKAWNLLFAVSDWATAKSKQETPKPSFKDTIADLRRWSDYDKYKREFKPNTVTSSDVGFSREQVFKRSSAFLDSWQNGRWALVMGFIPPIIRKDQSEGWAIQYAKDTFRDYAISQWSIESIVYPQPSSADIRGVILLGDTKKQFNIRMALYCSSGNAAVPGQENADWYVGIWAPRQYFQNQA